MRSAASSSISRTGSRSTCTTRRTRTCSLTTAAPIATAACACRIRRSSARPWRRLRSLRNDTRRSASRACSGPASSGSASRPPVPVYLLYMNAYVDDAGKLVVREDLYGYDGRVRAALRGSALAGGRGEVAGGEAGGQSAGRRGRGDRRWRAGRSAARLVPVLLPVIACVRSRTQAIPICSPMVPVVPRLFAARFCHVSTLENPRRGEVRYR